MTTLKEKLESGEAFQGKLVHTSPSCIRFATDEGIEEIPTDWCKAGMFDGLEIGCEYIVVEDFPPGKDTVDNITTLDYVISIYSLDHRLVIKVSRDEQCPS